MPDNDPGIYTTGFPVFDDIFGPMISGDLHLIVGRTRLNHDLVDRTAVLAASRGDSVYYIDGGHGADPFSMARVLRMQRKDPRSVLERIMIARAFTAYQMDSLIREGVRSLQEPPDLLIISSLDSLFSDPEVDIREAKGMMRNCMTVLRETADRGACVLISAVGGGRESELLALMSPVCSNWASLAKRSGNRVRIVTRGGRWRDLVPLHPFQTMIEDYSSRGSTEEAA
ncbi:MAG: hypothetical protein U9R75_03115 [Candidatus Thermoplasmatota archaeon]|nr:hypothetical protein [Candidatus Thermoplasmatota archaeon]